ncbi:MAG TPA: tetratricopeptide repeat protein [Candidatus Sulfotelmatobacter sp.]|nr:tetratricopeptide repeat protein [Candidatus Sulfotelmatobacter sp.]
MKRIAIIGIVLGICASSWGQDKPASQTPPAGQASAQAAGQAAAPPGKRPAKVNSQEEYAAYKAAVAITDPAAAEKAAEDFATKYPQSEVRPMVYKAVMQRYQQVNNLDKVVEMSKKVLVIDPDDPEALVSVAQVQAEKVKDDSLDKDVALAEAKKNAERALVTVDSDVPTSGYPEEQLKMYKNFIRSQAYFVLGTAAFKASNWAEAETNLKKSIDALPQQPDVIAVYRLALSLDFQNKIPEALKAAQQAVDLTKDNPDSAAGKAARQEQDRLMKYASTGTSGQTTTPPKN